MFMIGEASNSSDHFAKGFIIDGNTVYIKIVNITGQKGFIGTVEEAKEFIDLLQLHIAKAEALGITIKGN